MLFGEANALDGRERTFLLEDFQNDDKSTIPQYGSVITVTGVCLSAPIVQGNFATLFIRDDAQGAVSFYSKIKIVITGGVENKNEINSLSKDLGTGMHVGVKGRVERLNKEDDVETKDGCKMLRFRLVIDSDDHALFSREIEPPKLTRQLSQSWWPSPALSENGDELVVKVGDFLVLNVGNNVYCTVNTEPEHILKHVVAFKNTFDGEILVGVTENGEITGMELCSGEIKNWCDKINKDIGILLPRSNEGPVICHNIQEANNYVDRRRCFVCVLPLYNDKSRSICWIHVPKGEAKVYFTKPSDVHAFKQIGVENRRIKDYDHLFNHLELLANRKIEPVPEEDYDEKDDEQDEEKSELEKEYRILEELVYENHHHKFKMIFGDNPKRTIQEKYLASNACGFLNSEGGSIFFGIQKDERTRIGYIMGIVLYKKERKELEENMVKTLRNFYPPVGRNQFQIKFHPVRVPSDYIVRDKGGGKMYAITGPRDKIRIKWPKFIKNIKESEKCSAVIPIRSQRFCVVSTKQTFDHKNVTELLEQFVERNSGFKLVKLEESELDTILKNIWVVQLKINQSPYPIHMTKTIDTYVFTKDEERQLHTSKLSLEDLMCRFKFDSTSEFNVDKFLKHVKNFDYAGISYILITSPFHFPENERDLYGLSIPKWTLTIDFDQHPRQPGHLFRTLNDRLLSDKGPFLKTLEDSQLDFNPDHAVCWLDNAEWNETQRSRLRETLNKGSKIVSVVVLWDEGHDKLVERLQTILKDLISLTENDGTEVTFVCATSKASSDICGKIIEPLREDTRNILSEDRVCVAHPCVLARFLSLNLPSPLPRPGDDYQVPHKKYFSSGGAQIIPQILPEGLRQNLADHIEIMYMKKGGKPDEQKLNKERREFYSGSAITVDGLHGNIAIRRTKIDELEKLFRTISQNMKSQVSFISVKVDRGAGSTTMCLQFLYEQHRSYPCAQLIKIKDGLVSHVDEINKKTKLPLILFVDKDIAHLPDFLDFKKEVEHRKVNVIFILIEPAEAFFDSDALKQKVCGQQETSEKTARDSFLYGPSSYEEVELRRGLDKNEMEQLVKVLTDLTKGKKEELLRFKESAGRNKPRTFAQFSLLAFGSEFKGLKKYVKFRLTLANERQQDILAFLSLTHVFTDCYLQASTLTHFLKKATVELDKELEDKYLQELLSPLVDGSDSRRILFHEVAKEILKQLSVISVTVNTGGDPYWNYIKDVSGDDPLLDHIQGDIIRLYVVILENKLKTKDDMETIVTYARESSECFERVRSKRPHMSHGYISDAMVRITVMQAGIKLMGNKNVSFVDYLIEKIEKIKGTDQKISLNSRYLLSLISDAYEYLDERVIDIGQREKWKEIFLECIGDLNNLTRLCDKIQQDKNYSPLTNYSTWLSEILLQIQILHIALEIENEDLSPPEIESKLKKLEEYGFHSKFEHHFMKFWIRYSSQPLTVQNLKEVNRRLNEWSSKMRKNRIAEFYE